MEVSCGPPWWSDGNESACDAGDPALIPGSERAPGEGNGKTHSSILAGESHRGAWQTAVHGVAKSRTRLSVHTQQGWHVEMCVNLVLPGPAVCPRARSLTSLGLSF